ncbi:MAG: type II toxin-antitoxin system PemK/MazF family toxin [Defluviitaleaceae bacterium]|nr:type II toxin-antitoxin system PemK/MazF family toxin [Defluviitaleaceae bacterium]
MKFNRGDIYLISFPQTFDPKHLGGKKKYVVVLQEGANYDKYDTIAVLLLTSNPACKNYHTVVTIELGSTKLLKESYIQCSQPYTIKKSWLSGAGHFGQLSVEKLDEVDEKLYIGLCMGIQNG